MGDSDSESLAILESESEPESSHLEMLESESKMPGIGINRKMENANALPDISHSIA